MSTVFENRPDNNENAAGEGLTDCGPARLALGGEIVVQIHEVAGESLLSFNQEDLMQSQVGDVVSVPIKTEASVHVFALYI